MNIHGKLAVVTGASSGIGAATAHALAKAGATVILLARTQSALDAEVAKIQHAGGQAHAFAVDVGDPAAVQAVAQQIKAIGTPTIIINNAGSGQFLSIEETSAADVQAMMAVPYFAAFYVSQAFLPAMLKQRQGMIVNVTSPASRLPWAGATAYAVARGAMRSFSMSLRADLYGTGVKTMLVTPGKVSSSYFSNNPASEERIPLIAKISRTVTPEEVAHAIVCGIQRDKREVVLPFMVKVFFGLYAVAPRLIEWLIYRTGWKRRLKVRMKNEE